LCLKFETRIKERDNDLFIVLSNLVVKKGGLEVGDILEIELQGTNLTIKNKQVEMMSLDKIVSENTEDIVSKTLREEELILAK
jgi:hypothetical protein